MSWIGIAVRELVGLAQNVAAIIQQHGLGGSRAAVDADKAADGLALLECCRRKLLAPVGFLEAVEFSFFRNQAFRAGLCFLLLAAEFDVVHQLLVSLIAADAIVFALAEFDRAQGGEVLRVVRNLDQVFRLRALGNRNFALLPHARNVRLPGLAHALDKAVRSAQQQNVWPQRVAAR